MEELKVKRQTSSVLKLPAICIAAIFFSSFAFHGKNRTGNARK